MPNLCFQGKTYACAEGDTVLESLTRQGAAIPSSCRSGVCQSCLLRATNGTVPPKAQNGLKETLQAQNYFLACLCTPTTDLEIALPGEDAVRHIPATVVGKEPLNRDILRLTLRSQEPFDYRAGQFLRLIREDGLIRSYSLANLPGADSLLELHIRRLPGGKMSEWIFESVQVGDTLEVAGPSGDCFYTPRDPDQGLLLISTGTGLAPLWGVLRDALQQGHTGPIHLFHGSWNPDGLYLVEELRRLSAQYPNVFYTPCVDEGAEQGYTAGRADKVAHATLPKLKGWRVFLCGHPDMVKSSKKQAFLSGASIRDIYADPFVLAKN